jgi:hypothetical protein
LADFTTYANAFRERLEDFTALPLYWPNDDRSPAGEPNGFVYSEIRVLREQPMSLGQSPNRWHRDFGEFAIYVYVPKGSRVGTAEGYAEQIRALFKMSNVAGATITNRTIGPGVVAGSGADSSGRYWGVPVILAFHADRKE